MIGAKRRLKLKECLCLTINVTIAEISTRSAKKCSSRMNPFHTFSCIYIELSWNDSVGDRDGAGWTLESLDLITVDMYNSEVVHEVFYIDRGHNKLTRSALQ